MSEIQITPPWDGAKTFEVKMRKEKGNVQKAIFVGGELLDWNIDMDSYMEAVKMGFMYQRDVQRDIEKHFITSVSDFLGRKITMEDIKKAIQTGWI